MPGRVIVLALRSRFRSAATNSVRTDAVSLRAILRNIGPSEYIVVTGQMGVEVGTTVVFDTVTQRKCGPSVTVVPGTPQDTIVSKVFAEFANSQLGRFDPRSSAIRVLWLYSWLRLYRPIVILRAA